MMHRDDRRFFVAMAMLGGLYVGLIVAMLAADFLSTSPGHLRHALASPPIQYAILLSLISSSATAILSLWVAIPLGYLLARWEFFGKRIVELLIDVPIVLPPLVVGLSLLILFQTPIGVAVQHFIPFTYAIPGVILAQLTVSAALATRLVRVAFEGVSPRAEAVAMTLGCSRSQAFWQVAMPEAKHGILAAATMAWARALGEFGPVLIFAGATRMKTEVLPTTIFLELSVGNVESALAVSLLMIAVAFLVLALMRQRRYEDH